MRGLVPFADRHEAGRMLAERLSHLAGTDVVVLGLPRGGVPVAYEVAEALRAPLDVCVVRKLGVPRRPELGVGAIGEDGVRVVDEEGVRHAGVSPDDLAEVERRERDELARRVRRFRGDRARIPLEGRTAVVIDDGLATGSTAAAACQVVRAQGARRVVLAVPVAPPDPAERVGDAADEVVCLATPERFAAIGQFYEDFTQTPDDEVVALLRQAANGHAATNDDGTAEAATGVDSEVEIDLGAVRLGGHLTVPANATGLVVFVHGSGSSRHSGRNRYVAGVLNRAGLGTLLFDLLTGEEERDRSHVFDIALLAGRLTEVTRWVCARPEAAGLRLGWFGASTGAAAALVAATEPGARVAAIVSRGGRPDLAGDHLAAVRAPTLLVVGGSDHPVLELNAEAKARLRACRSELVVVPGATHLFAEPGTLEQAADLARGWFVDNLTG